MSHMTENGKMNKKKRPYWDKIVLFMVLFLLFNFNVCFSASANEILSDQEKSFGISDFIQESEKYSSDFFDGTNIKDILSNAMIGKVNNSTLFTKIISLFGNEVLTSIKSLAIILVIIIIHSILKSISDSLENESISKIVFYVQYILIVTIIMSNFTEIVTSVKETAEKLVGFMNSLIPLLATLMVYTGSITTTSLIEPIILFMINFIGNSIQSILIPLIMIIAVFSIISKISDKIQIEKLAKFLKSGTIWILGIILTLFVGVVSLEGTLSSSIDGITAKTTKAVVSTTIPVVGKILGDAVDTVLGCGVVLKNAIGIVGVLIVVSICAIPIIKLSVLTISYNLASAIVEPIADKKISDLLKEIGDIFKILLAILTVISVMLIIGITLVIKISNSGMMYR